MPRPKDKRREHAFVLYKKFRCNLSKVAEEPGMPAVGTLVRWKREDNWELRLTQARQDLSEFADLLKKGKGLPALENDIHELKVLQLLETYVGEEIDRGSIKPECWKDVLDTLKFVANERRLLIGKPTSRPEVVVPTESPEQVAEHRAFLEEAQRIIRQYQQPIKPPPDTKVVTSGDGNSPGSTAGSSQNT